MKKIIIALALLLTTTHSIYAADNSGWIINKVVSTYKALNGISANYSITTDQGATSGAITMQGNKFRMISPDLRCWFNGSVLWSYSTMSEEVSITQPSDAELQMVNPYSIISTFRNNFAMRQLKSGTAGNHEVELTPKTNDSDLKSVRLTISRKTYLPMKLIFAMTDGSYVTVVMSNYKGKENYPASTFVFSKELVPAGTPVVDLR